VSRGAGVATRRSCWAPRSRRGARGRGAQAAAAAGMRVVVVPSVPDRGAYPQACPDAESGAAWAARAPGLGYMVGLGFRAPPLP